MIPKQKIDDDLRIPDSTTGGLNLNFDNWNFGSNSTLPTGEGLRTELGIGPPKTWSNPNPKADPAGAWSREGAFGESGWAMPAIQGIGAAANIGLGFMNYREAKKTRQEQTRQFNKNFEMQSNVLAGRIKDRYYARQRMGGSSNYGSADEAVSAVMKR